MTEQTTTAAAELVLPDSALRIRRSALHLYAQRGPQGVGVREIAGDAQAAPGLIRHHFGSKAGLTRAVDDHVLAVIAEALERATPSSGEEKMPQSSAAVSAARDRAFAGVLRDSPDIAGYLRWCLVTPASAPEDDLVERLVDLTLQETERLRAQGLGGSRELRDSVLSTLLRQIGSLMVQPLADRIWGRLERTGAAESSTPPRVAITRADRGQDQGQGQDSGQD